MATMHDGELPSNAVDQKWLWCYSSQHAPTHFRAGKWMLFGNRVRKNSHGLTDYDHLWILVKDIVKSGSLCCANCSTSVSDEKNENGVIMCYTYDYKDKINVKQAVVKIRDLIHYPKDIYYKVDDYEINESYNCESILNYCLYKFSVDNLFYVKDDDGVSWNIVNTNSVRIPSPSVSISSRTNLNPATNEPPSKVFNTYWLWCRGSLVMSARIGKWLLFGNRVRQDSTGLTDFDRLWFLIKQVVEAGKLYASKCSTSKLKNETDTEGIIVCYTPDYEDKADVKKAADAIRDFIDYPREIYYKTDVATASNEYVSNGNESVSMYKHTRGNQLFERTNDGTSWKLVVFDS